MVDIKKPNQEAALDYRQTLRSRADELADLLSQSNEYLQFLEARKSLEADEERSHMLNELRQQQMNLRMAAMLGEDVAEDNSEFERMFLMLSQDPRISEYLFAEGRFFHLISEMEESFARRLGLSRYFDDSAMARNTDIHLN